MPWQKSELTGQPIAVVAAGGVYDSRGLAMALSLGASGVWVGTRFHLRRGSWCTSNTPKNGYRNLFGRDHEDDNFYWTSIARGYDGYVKNGKKTAKMRSKLGRKRYRASCPRRLYRRPKNGEEVNPLEYRYWLMGQAAAQ